MPIAAVRLFVAGLLLSLFCHPGVAADRPDGDLAPLGNRDGMVTAADGLIALRYARGQLTPIPADDLLHGDVFPLNGNKPNPDGVIDEDDVTTILEVALGLRVLDLSDFGTLALGAADQPAVGPCPTQAVLTDQTELDALKTAMTTGAVTYLDIPFNGADPDIYKKKCGLEGFWNPVNNVNEVSPGPLGITAITIAQLLNFGNSGICSDGFNNASFGVDEGFPVAGVYRNEHKAMLGNTTYHLRWRATTSGTAAGESFADLGLTYSGAGNDVENTLVYEVNGAVTPHADVYAAMVNAMTVVAGDAPSATLVVKQGSTAIFQVVLEFICVTKTTL